MLGMFAVSRAGHDIGQIYIIIKEAGEYVYLADGKTKTLERPKRKNKKHIQVIRKGSDPELTDKLQNSQPIYNEEIKHLIKTNFKYEMEVFYVEG